MSLPFERELTVRSSSGRTLWAAEVGNGTPLVLCDGLGCDGYVWPHVIQFFARTHRVVRFHYRGHGRSDVPEDLGEMTIEGCVDDLLDVMDRMGIASAVLAGHSMGVQVLLEAALRVPDRVSGLALVCGAPGRPLDTFKNTSLGLQVLPLLRTVTEGNAVLSKRFWKAVVPSKLALRIAEAFEINANLIEAEDISPYLQRLANMDPKVFLAMLDAASRHTAEPRLGEVSQPTLVVAAENDTFTPMHRSLTMKAKIPDAELFVLPEATHTGPLEWPELLNLRIRKFLRQNNLAPLPAR